MQWRCRRKPDIVSWLSKAKYQQFDVKLSCKGKNPNYLHTSNIARHDAYWRNQGLRKFLQEISKNWRSKSWRFGEHLFPISWFVTPLHPFLCNIVWRQFDDMWPCCFQRESQLVINPLCKLMCPSLVILAVLSNQDIPIYKMILYLCHRN